MRLCLGDEKETEGSNDVHRHRAHSASRDAGSRPNNDRDVTSADVTPLDLGQLMHEYRQSKRYTRLRRLRKVTSEGLASEGLTSDDLC